MSPRRREQQFVWIRPKTRRPKWSVTIDGVNVSKYLLDGSCDRGLIAEELLFQCTLNNNGGTFTDRFTQGHEIVVYRDYVDGSTAFFKGFVEEVKSKVNNQGFNYEIKGAHYTAKALDVTITKSYTGSAVSDIRADLMSNLSGFTSNNVVSNSSTLSLSFNGKPLLDCLALVDLQAGEDCFVDNDKDLHSFTKESVNVENEAVFYRDALIELHGLGSDGVDVRNNVRVEGEAGGLPVLYTSGDSGSQSSFGVKTAEVKNSSIKDESDAQSLSDANVSQQKSPPVFGSADCYPLMDFSPGGMLWVVSPPHKVHSRFRVVKETFYFPKVASTVYFSQVRGVPKLFKDRILKEQGQEKLTNPFDMTHSYNFVFDDDSKIDVSSSSNYSLSEGNVLKGSGETGVVVSDVKSTPVTVNSVHLLVRGDNLSGTTFRVRASNAVSWDDADVVGVDSLVSLSSSGKELSLRIEITGSTTRIDSVALLYKS